MTESLASRLLDWLARNREWFAKASSIELKLKLLGELALTAELAGRRDWGDQCAELIAFAWDRLNRGDDIATAGRAAPALVTIYPSFWRSGCRHDATDALLDDQDWLAKIPRIPLQLPIELVRRATGRAGFWDVAELLAETAVLAKLPDPGTLPDQLVYTLTHTTFLLTNYGAEPDGVPKRERDYLTRTLPGWLAVYSGRGNRDLVAELIMTAHCIGLCAPQSAWPILDAPLRDPANGHEFVTAYHPHLVSLMALAMCAHA